MKNIFKERKIHIACVCLLLVMLLAGCSNSDTNNQETDLFDVLNRADSVKIGNHIVVYNSESGNICYGEMVNDKPKIIKNIALPYKNANVNQIIASDNWIYVVVEVMASEKTADVRIICRYDLQMNLNFLFSLFHLLLMVLTNDTQDIHHQYHDTFHSECSLLFVPCR